MTKNFITTGDYTKAQLQLIIDKAIAYKKGQEIPDYSNKILTLIFANPSLRTRLSFESGMKKLGGKVNVLSATDAWEFEYKKGVVMNGNTQEYIKEAAQVISSYTDLIALRKSDLMTKKSSTQEVEQTWEELKKDQPIYELARYADKPIISMESNMFHPCQSMADVMTMQEHFGSLTGKKIVLTWAPHPKALPLATPHSQLLTPSIFGADVTLACPSGFELDADVMNFAKGKAGKFSITNNQVSALEDADVVIAKSWASLKYFGDWKAESDYRKKFTDWMVDKNKMDLTNNAIFMHCLPVRRNVVASDEVLDSEQSVVIQEAENRMWVQMGIIDYLLG